MNRFLKTDIYISEIFKVEEDHHTRFDAISREYKYYVSQEKLPFFSPISYHFYGDLDIELMNKACDILFEYEDFTSFSKLHTQTKTNNCKIIKAHWTKSNGLLVFTIEADRFLRNMVRAITGTMLSIGQGKLTLSEFRHIIESKDRSKAGFSVPGNALFLHEVKYPQSILQYKKNKGLAQDMPFN
ncbi:MAG: tRNA pseudouridine(38-40) synthase TruA [Hyphomicrobiales bacterium]